MPESAMNKEEIEKLLAPAMTEVAKTGRSVDAIADVVEKLEAAHQKEIRMLQRGLIQQINQTMFVGMDLPTLSEITVPAAVLELKRVEAVSAIIRDVFTTHTAGKEAPKLRDVVEALGASLGVNDLTTIESDPNAEDPHVFAFSPSLFRFEDSPAGRAEAAASEHPLTVAGKDGDQEEPSRR